MSSYNPFDFSQIYLNKEALNDILMWDNRNMKKCTNCKDGKITLFTSVQTCDKCNGTGFLGAYT